MQIDGHDILGLGIIKAIQNNADEMVGVGQSAFSRGKRHSSFKENR